MRDVDVAIAGGGPAGAIAALVLARAGVRVRVFERARFPRHKLCGDTVNPGALALLQRLGVDDAAGTHVIDGMLVTAEHGVQIAGRYPSGVTGRAVLRESLDHALLAAAANAGAIVDEAVMVQAASSSGGAVDGIYITGRSGARHRVGARVVIAADGRYSRVARSLGLGCYPASPRRWAVGGYFSDVAGTTSCGEMHIRSRQYVGVAPVPGGLTNTCVVTSDRRALADPTGLLHRAVRGDPQLRHRFAGARLASMPVILGPLAVDVDAAGVPGLLLAGDASGFIDPMTGDGLHFAIRGAELAAHEALRAITDGGADGHVRLQRTRTREFRAKWMFNRALRGLAESPSALRIAGVAAARLPACIEQAIRYAGDVPSVAERSGYGDAAPRIEETWWANLRHRFGDVSPRFDERRRK